MPLGLTALLAFGAEGPRLEFRRYRSTVVSSVNCG
jgi:hypothetical protein